MSMPNVNKRTASDWLDKDTPSGVSYPCKHGEIYNCGTIYNVYCGFCDTLNSVSGRNVAAASNFICPKCHELIPNSSDPIAVDGFNLIRHYNKDLCNFDCINQYYIGNSFGYKKPILQRQTGVYVPQPRLVGIELHPGPPKKSKATYKNPIGPQTQAQAKKQGKRKGKNRKGKSVGSRSFNKLHPLLRKHYRNVLDPFNNPATYHCFDTEVETPMQGNTVLQGTLVLNADGSGFIACRPNLIQVSSGSATTVPTNFVTLNNSAAATTGAYTALTAPNYSNLSNQMPTYKVLAAGIRVTPLVAQTAVPGIIYGDAWTTNGTTNALTAFTPSTNTLITGPNAKRMIAESKQSYIIPWTPESENSNNFSTVGIKATNDAAAGSIIYIAFSGFPASSAILYDIIVHIEGYTTGATATASNNINFPGAFNVKPDNLSDAGIPKGILYNPPAHAYRNPYDESDSKYSSNNSKTTDALLGASDIFDKVANTVNTASDVASFLSSFI